MSKLSLLGMFDTLDCFSSQFRTSVSNFTQKGISSNIFLTSSAKAVEIGSLPPTKDGIFASPNFFA